MQVRARLASADACTSVMRPSLQVCKREDSETYAKRTITEIETCLGFRFNQGAAPAAEEETINDVEIAVSDTAADGVRCHTWEDLPLLDADGMRTVASALHHAWG